MIYKNGEYKFDWIKKKPTKIADISDDKESLLWKILAKKKHQTPKSLYEVYQNALKFPIKKKIKKKIKRVFIQKHKKRHMYDVTACDYC